MRVLCRIIKIGVLKGIWACFLIKKRGMLVSLRVGVSVDAVGGNKFSGDI